MFSAETTYNQQESQCFNYSCIIAMGTNHASNSVGFFTEPLCVEVFRSNLRKVVSITRSSNKMAFVYGLVE